MTLKPRWGAGGTQLTGKQHNWKRTRTVISRCGTRFRWRVLSDMTQIGTGMAEHLKEAEAAARVVRDAYKATAKGK